MKSVVTSASFQKTVVDFAVTIAVVITIKVVTTIAANAIMGVLSNNTESTN
jgi:hypothetical protein